ncbi:hypothetical protein [Actinacidiphila bryophytorum]|nr:hypothetical protein [Actinacidiphila bryophytorum]
MSAPRGAARRTHGRGALVPAPTALPQAGPAADTPRIAAGVTR